MTTPTDVQNESQPEWHLDMFFEPRTMPANWDLSEMRSPPESSADEKLTARSPEAFPKPRTVPENWDVSALG